MESATLVDFSHVYPGTQTKPFQMKRAKWMGFTFPSPLPLRIQSKLRYRKWPLMTAKIALILRQEMLASQARRLLVSRHSISIFC